MKFLSALFFLYFFSSCAVVKKADPNKKFGPDQLKADYNLFKNILEEQHPGLYWYTSKDSMNFYFQKGEAMLKDSLTENSFKNVLSYVVAKIKCGHTTVRSSKAMARRSAGRFFPLVIKAWPDTAIVTTSLFRKDSIISRGALLTAIENRSINSIIDTMFQYLSADGHNMTHKYQTLSNRGVFGSMYASLFGARPRYQVNYIDTSGERRTASVPLFTILPDSTRRIQRPPMPQPSPRERKKQRLDGNRMLRFDTTLSMAIMDLNTFANGYRLHRFIKSSFKKLKERNIENLVIDLRANGGGSVTNSNLLTKYISNKSFKIADSLYAIKRSSRYGKYQKDRLGNWLFLQFMTHKQKDGNYHFGLFERKFFKPKKKDHFDEQLYILTGGNTFSASTLFTVVVKDQRNVTVVGEETGGGAYGNNAWLIPDVTLPITKLRFRLPLFRLVINKNLPKNGRGIFPEVESLPTVNDIRNGVDYKMEKVRSLIKASH